MIKIGKIIQAGKVEEIENDVTFDDKHPTIKNIKCSIGELAKTGLPLYIKFVSGKNRGIIRGIVWYHYGVYAEPKYPYPFDIDDKYIIFTS